MMTGQVSKQSARERLLAAASKLFYARGMTATGIDAVTAEAGVAKMSLYNNFSSKETLMLAYIDARHDEWLTLYRIREAKASNAKERVLAVFDAYLDHASQYSPEGFRGCGLLNAAAELPVDAAGRRAVRRHKEEVEHILTDALEATDVNDPEGMAEHFSFLLEGAVSRAGLEGSSNRLVAARKIAASLLSAV